MNNTETTYAEYVGEGRPAPKDAIVVEFTVVSAPVSAELAGNDSDLNTTFEQARRKKPSASPIYEATLRTLGLNKQRLLLTDGRARKLDTYG